MMQAPTQIVDSADVVVAGGGTAGIVAALSAARNGARTILIERTGHLGGMVTGGNAGMTMYMKYSGELEKHARDQAALATDPAQVQVAGGITKEIADRLISMGAGIGNDGQAGSYVFTSSEDFKWLLFEMMKEAGVVLRLHSWVVDVIADDGAVVGLVTESKEGRQAILAKQAIDATGDGDIAVRMGVPYTVDMTEDDLSVQHGSKVGVMTPMGVMFKVGNVDVKRLLTWAGEEPSHFRTQRFARLTYDEVVACFDKGEMACCTISTGFDEAPKGFQVYNLPTEGVVTLCCPFAHGDGTKVEDLTNAEMAMAEIVRQWMGNIVKLPGFETAFLLDCPEIGVRETRHIAGDYLLTIEDVYNNKEFPDCIGRGSHPIDAPNRVPWLKDVATAFPDRWSFGIPYGCLLAKGVPNLHVVGRCLSATHEASGSIRPTVQCMITGEAAGAAAALCTKQGIANLRKLDIKQLQETLAAQGVVL